MTSSLSAPGGRVPADGAVVEGTADVDESMITGESKTVAKSPGTNVIAGTVISGGSLRVCSTAVGEQTALSGIMRLVAAAQASGSRSQALADRAAALLFYVAIVAGATTFVYWWLSGDKEHALIRAATVLIIAPWPKAGCLVLSPSKIKFVRNQRKLSLNFISSAYGLR